jgi:glutamate dehydrogenase/leucine dehydrogenase
MTTRRDSPSAEIIELTSVPGFVVFDLPGAPTSAGGTRLAPDVSSSEVALLARAMTYKLAALGEPSGGAKAGVAGDPGDRVAKAALMSRYCAEILPLVDAGRFRTGPDMGTSEEDFTPLRGTRRPPAAMRAVVEDVPFEDILTGYGVVVAAETALSSDGGGGWEGRCAAIEGFGKVGGGVAREIEARGGRVAAVSTLAGFISDPSGLDVQRLLDLRRVHGDDCVLHYGLSIRHPSRLFTTVDADVVIPGARPGAIGRPVAESLPNSVRVIAPAANAPYTVEGAEVLRYRGIIALADFVCNAGAVIGYRSADADTPQQVLEHVGTRIAALTRAALEHPSGPLTGACEQAASFLRSWWGDPPDPPFAGTG